MKKTLTTILLFAGMASAWASSLPYGDYKASCKDIKMVGTSLQASCSGGPQWITSQGQVVLAPMWSETKLDNANTCAIADNQEGQLVCLEQK